MAIIGDISSSFKSFMVNGSEAKLSDCKGTYNTYDILNGGETYDKENGLLNILSYTFSIKGLNGHKIKNIVVSSLLLTKDGELNSACKFKLILNGSLVSGNIEASNLSKIIVPTIFNVTDDIDLDEYLITLEVLNMSNESCYYSVHSVLVNLADIKYKVQITFTGPNTGRKANSIEAQALVLNQGAVSVSFAKDSSIEYDKTKDTIEGRAYFRKDGIFVDGYQYGTVAPATEFRSGIVKLKTEVDLKDGGTVVVDEVGVATSPKYVVSLLNNLTDLVKKEVVTPASDNKYGVVKLSDDQFEIDEETGDIVLDEEDGIAATPMLVIDALIKAKHYVDEHALQEISIETPEIEVIVDEETEEETYEYKKKSLREGFTFSLEFEERDKKIHISWLNL